MRGKSGFTIIEFIMVIIIIGVLSSIMLPALVNLKAKAIENSEDNIIGAINTAIKTKQLQFAAQTGEGSFPADNPFTLIEKLLPYIEYSPTPYTPPDNYNWRYKYAGSTRWWLYCPHWNGSYDSDTGASKGRFYAYHYGEFGGWPNFPAGKLGILFNKSH